MSVATPTKRTAARRARARARRRPDSTAKATPAKRSARKPITKKTIDSTPKGKASARKKVATKSPSKKDPTKAAAKKAPAKKAPAVNVPAKSQKLVEFNPYDKKGYPRHYDIAQMLLGGKQVSYSEMYDKLGLSPRTLARVVADIEACNIVVHKLRDEDRAVSYIVVAGKGGPKKVASTPLAA